MKRKTSKKTKKYEFPVIIEKDKNGYYFAKVVNLRGCHTQAKTLPELYKRLKEAIELCLDVEDQKKEQLLSPNEFVGFQKMEIFRSNKLRYA